MNSNSHHPYPSRPIQVIHTEGTDFEIGFQHGKLLKDVVDQGMLKFYLDFWKRMLDTNPAGFLDKALFRIAKKAIDPLLVNQLLKQVPHFLKERLRGISEASGMPLSGLLTTLVLPDLLPILQAYLGKIRPSALIEAAQPPRFGCTSFVAAGKDFFQGRNLDFPGVGYWDRFQTIQLFRRTDSIPYIGFTTAGVPVGGITGINQEGIMVALHQHYSKSTSLFGTLPYAISEEILMKAHNLEEAKSILKGSRVAASWAFVISDGKSGRALLYECDAATSGLHEINENDERIAHSNFFQTTGCLKNEYATTARMNWDNYYRSAQLERKLAKIGDELTEVEGVQFLSDHVDPYWQEEKIINRTVSQVYNIQSVLVNHTKMKAFMAEGDCPVHLGVYKEFDLNAIFLGKKGITGHSLNGYRFQSEERREAKLNYILSFVAGFDNRLEEALSYVQKVLSIEMCPEASLVAAILFLKLHRYSSALECLTAAKKWIEEKKMRLGKASHPPEYFEICLFLARTFDLLGEREHAIAEYEALVKHEDLEDSNVRKLAVQKGPYTKQKLEKILTPYSTYIPFE